MPASALATIAGLSRASGVDVESLQHYLQLGLLPPPQRLPGHKAQQGFRQEHLERLQFIRRARDLGFSVEDIAGLLGLHGGLVTCGDAARIAARHLETLRAQIEDLRTDPGKRAKFVEFESLLMPIMNACANSGSGRDCTILRALSDGA